MPDMEKVIKGMAMCISQGECSPDDCPYYDRPDNASGLCWDRLMTDALVLLKEQKEVEPIETGFKVAVKVRFDYECICGAPMLKDQPFCMECGRKVKWDA